MLIENIDHHRSRERIRDLGEVFTQEKYVEQMLDLFAEGRPSVWSDENTTFFEPCAGHGNFLVAILRRRFEAMFKKARTQGKDEPALYAVANAINTLWGVDIDASNVESCRLRLFNETCLFLADKYAVRDVGALVSKTGDFLAHVLCAIRWQIQENEALSALSDGRNAITKANATKMGQQWLAENGHRYVDFEASWVNYYRSCCESGTTPIEYEKAERFLQNSGSGKSQVIKEFSFARTILKGDFVKIHRHAQKAAS